MLRCMEGGKPARQSRNRRLEQGEKNKSTDTQLRTSVGYFGFCSDQERQERKSLLFSTETQSAPCYTLNVTAAESFLFKHRVRS